MSTMVDYGSERNSTRNCCSRWWIMQVVLGHLSASAYLIRERSGYQIKTEDINPVPTKLIPQCHQSSTLSTLQKKTRATLACIYSSLIITSPLLNAYFLASRYHLKEKNNPTQTHTVSKKPTSQPSPQQSSRNSHNSTSDPSHQS